MFTWFFYLVAAVLLGLSIYYFTKDRTALAVGLLVAGLAVIGGLFFLYWRAKAGETSMGDDSYAESYSDVEQQQSRPVHKFSSDEEMDRPGRYPSREEAAAQIQRKVDEAYARAAREQEDAQLLEATSALMHSESDRLARLAEKQKRKQQSIEAYKARRAFENSLGYVDREELLAENPGDPHDVALWKSTNARTALIRRRERNAVRGRRGSAAI